jgi:hypothetical protein
MSILWLTKGGTVLRMFLMLARQTIPTKESLVARINQKVKENTIKPNRLLLQKKEDSVKPLEILHQFA